CSVDGHAPPMFFQTRVIIVGLCSAIIYNLICTPGETLTWSPVVFERVRGRASTTRTCADVCRRLLGLPDHYLLLLSLPLCLLFPLLLRLLMLPLYRFFPLPRARHTCHRDPANSLDDRNVTLPRDDSHRFFCQFFPIHVIVFREMPSIERWDNTLSELIFIGIVRPCCPFHRLGGGSRVLDRQLVANH
ncbi:hypothetical protein B0H14DRAFT_2834351, partial [Mycena olivaceomarginata]